MPVRIEWSGPGRKPYYEMVPSLALALIMAAKEPRGPDALDVPICIRSPKGTHTIYHPKEAKALLDTLFPDIQ